MNKSTTTNEGVEKHIMDLLKVEASQIFSGHALRNLTIEKQRSEILDALTYTLWTMVPAEHMKTKTHELSIEYPTTWWQMFKMQYFPNWFKAYFPVKYTIIRKTVRFDAFALYPKMPRIFECGDYKQIIMTRGMKKKMREGREWVEKGETTRYFLFGVVVGVSVSAILIFSLLIFTGVQ